MGRIVKKKCRTPNCQDHKYIEEAEEKMLRKGGRIGRK